MAVGTYQVRASLLLIKSHKHVGNMGMRSV